MVCQLCKAYREERLEFEEVSSVVCLLSEAWLWLVILSWLLIYTSYSWLP